MLDRGNPPPQPMGAMLEPGIEQARQAMENYLQFFQKGMSSSPWAGSELNSKVTGCIQKNITTAFDFAQKLSQAKDPLEILRIQMTVTLATTNDATLKAFAETGRYTLKSEIKDESFVVFAPLLQNLIKINGSDVKEQINYIIYVPKGATVLKNGDSNKIVAKLNP